MNVRMLNSVVVVCIGLSIAAMLQPWWSDGFRVGFFALLISTIAHIITSHLQSAQIAE